MNNYGDKGQGNFYKVRSGSVFFESDPNPDLANLNPDPQPWFSQPDLDCCMMNLSFLPAKTSFLLFKSKY